MYLRRSVKMESSYIRKPGIKSLNSESRNRCVLQQKKWTLRCVMFVRGKRILYGTHEETEIVIRRPVMHWNEHFIVVWWKLDTLSQGAERVGLNFIHPDSILGSSQPFINILNHLNPVYDANSSNQFDGLRRSRFLQRYATMMWRLNLSNLWVMRWEALWAKDSSHASNKPWVTVLCIPELSLWWNQRSHSSSSSGFYCRQKGRWLTHRKCIPRCGRIGGCPGVSGCTERSETIMSLHSESFLNLSYCPQICSTFVRQERSTSNQDWSEQHIAAAAIQDKKT